MAHERHLPSPTDRELEILGVLWDRGPSTVREVYEQLGDRRATGYTTFLKLMQIMADKGLLLRDEGHRSHVYLPRLTREVAQRRLVDDLLDKAFGGSARQLVMRLLSSESTSEEQLSRIRALLEEVEKEGQSS
jgi:predicted transcriptional regulator